MVYFLHLPHMRTLHVRDCGDHYEVEAEGSVVPTACPASLPPRQPETNLSRHANARQARSD